MSTKGMGNRQLPTPKQNMISFVTKRTRHAQQPKKPKRTAEDYQQELKREYRRDYFYRIHNEELKKIIKKVTVVAPTYVEPVVKHQLLERT
ncbi:hypothetical protein VE02_10240 [Pseudogymnoascus sp. 03VT05]|nr:hypothetical protein VE02_10240 [Pseudogymnoascus sp. 03VT05]